jgi:hypothetical protein
MIYEVGVITPVRESDGGRTLHGFNDGMDSPVT